MIQPDLRLQKPLEDYVEYFDRLSARSIPLIEKYSDISIAFQDNAFNVRGQDAMQKVLRRRFEIYPSARYEVYDFMWGRRAYTAYMQWGFSYNEKGGILKRPEQKVLHAMVEIGFSPEGKVCSHIEFWKESDPFQNKLYRRPLG